MDILWLNKAVNNSSTFHSRWHLGFCDVKCTATYRGFDTFYGFYQGYIDHYSHMVGGGYDWWDNVAGGGETSRKDLDGQYAGVRLPLKSTCPFLHYNIAIVSTYKLHQIYTDIVVTMLRKSRA